MKAITILFDPGHGKIKPGAVSPVYNDTDRIYEYEYCRKLVNKIIEELSKLNIKSINIVDGDETPGLTERANKANKIASTTQCILISVHCNAGGGTGWEVWTTAKKNNSDKLAKCFTDIYPSIFPNEKLRGAKEKNFTVIYKANMPCVLTENFFLDTHSDALLLNSEEGFNNLVKLHVEAIKNYLEYGKNI